MTILHQIKVIHLICVAQCLTENLESGLTRSRQVHAEDQRAHRGGGNSALYIIDIMTPVSLYFLSALRVREHSAEMQKVPPPEWQAAGKGSVRQLALYRHR